MTELFDPMRPLINRNINSPLDLSTLFHTNYAVFLMVSIAISLCCQYKYFTSSETYPMTNRGRISE